MIKGLVNLKIDKEKIMYYVLVFGSIIVFLFGSIKYSKLNNKNLFNCNNIIITGCNLVNEQSIENQLAYLKNKSILDIDKSEIVMKLKNNEFISSANIAIILPSTIFIRISEIHPISIISIANSHFLVDENSHYFPYILNQAKSIAVPRIFLNNITEIENVFNQVQYQFIKNIYSDYHLLYKKINQIQFSDNEVIVSFNKNTVHFNSNGYMIQLKYLSEFFNTLDNLNKNYDYEYIKFAGANIIVKENKKI